MKRAQINQEEFIKMWNSGASGQEMISHFGVTRQTLWRLARTIPECIPRKVGRPRYSNTSNYSSFVKMWNDDKPLEEISKKFGITVRSVSNRGALIPECKQRRKGRKAKYVLEDKLLFIKMWNDNVPVQIIAKKFNFSIIATYRMAKKIPECMQR